MILDGGLATELERHGYDLDHPLWSARLVTENPEAIKDVHLSYLRAGADIITTASYQASFPGCRRLGMSDKETEELLKKTVKIAIEARAGFTLESGAENLGSLPLIAASIGPYGAYLADGSEYRGDYDVSEAVLHEFHDKRLRIMQETDADLIACETIPNIEEAEVLSELLENGGGKPTWVSFCCKNEVHISDGTPIEECAALFAESDSVFALGINCTAPRFVSNLIDEIKKAAPEKEIVVYPNSGETYDADSKSWKKAELDDDITRLALGWFAQGARLIGGCCRTKPREIQSIRSLLSDEN